MISQNIRFGANSCMSTYPQHIDSRGEEQDRGFLGIQKVDGDFEGNFLAKIVSLSTIFEERRDLSPLRLAGRRPQKASRRGGEIQGDGAPGRSAGHRDPRSRPPRRAVGSQAGARSSPPRSLRSATPIARSTASPFSKWASTTSLGLSAPRTCWRECAPPKSAISPPRASSVIIVSARWSSTSSRRGGARRQSVGALPPAGDIILWRGHSARGCRRGDWRSASVRFRRSGNGGAGRPRGHRSVPAAAGFSPSSAASSIHRSNATHRESDASPCLGKAAEPFAPRHRPAARDGSARRQDPN